MKDEIVQFETAKLAKEKGFQISLREIQLHLGQGSSERKIMWMSLLQKWLREIHEIDIQPIVNYNQFKQIKSYRTGIIYITQLSDRRLLQTFFIRPKEDKILFIEFSTYEEALEAGLINGLNLIV